MYVNVYPQANFETGRPDLVVVASEPLVGKEGAPAFRTFSLHISGSRRAAIWNLWLLLKEELSSGRVASDGVTREYKRATWHGSAGTAGTIKASFGLASGYPVLDQVTATAALEDGTSVTFEGRGFGPKIADLLGGTPQAAVEAALDS